VRGWRDLVSRRCRFALCAIALASGCDNAVEHLSVEEWREVGTASAPNTDARYVVRTLAPGGEREVLRGDLVQLRVVTSNGSEREVFVWTGAHTAADSPPVLGADGLRAALIGRRVGERFAIGLDQTAPEVAWLPMYGAMSTLEFPGLSFAYAEDGVRIRAREWPRVDLSSEADEPGRAEIEVLDACAARLLQRTATLRQWGYVVELSAARVAPRREGTLHWLKFEAACVEGARHLQVGPLYDERRSLRGQGLYGWEGSYVRLRPPERFPEEWELTPLR
jgi:hypothetical protein